MTNTNQTILNKTQNWLNQNGYKHIWLADKLGISNVYMSQIFSLKRALLPQYIISISKLSEAEDTPEEVTYFVRGKVSNEAGKKALVQALLDADRFANLVAGRK